MQGNLAGALAVVKGTPTTYNKDFQEVGLVQCRLLHLHPGALGLGPGFGSRRVACRPCTQPPCAPALPQIWHSMYDSVDTLNDCIGISTGVVSTLAIRPQRMLASLSADMLATDLAEYLVRKGVPFRETHHISGGRRWPAAGLLLLLGGGRWA
jgi:argininosuccinate lyase